MRIALERIECGRKRNVSGRVVSRKYVYVITIRRWFRKPLYLRLLPKWFDDFMHGIPCKVELTSSRGNATEFREDGETSSYLRRSTALELIAAIKKNPDLFILN